MVNNTTDFDPSKLDEGHRKLFRFIERKRVAFNNQLNVLFEESCEVCGVAKGGNHPIRKLLDEIIFGGIGADEAVTKLINESADEE